MDGTSLASRLVERGVAADRHETWGGLRWTRRCRVRMRSQGEVKLVSDRQRRARRAALLRTVKACGPGTRCWCQVSRRHTQPNRDVKCHAIRGATVAGGIRRRRARYSLLKPLRGECRVISRCLRCEYSCAYLTPQRARGFCGCIGHPAYPAPSVCKGREIFCQASGATRGPRPRNRI